MFLEFVQVFSRKKHSIHLPSINRWQQLSRLGLFLVMSILMNACTGTRPANLGVQEDRLAPCPASPNCVSSDAAADSSHFVEPYQLKSDPAEGWSQLVEVVKALPRTTVVTVTEDYLHAECKSLMLRFVDDLEFHWRSAEGRIAVRSASRLGYSDFSVNRRRVEQVRDALREQDVIE